MTAAALVAIGGVGSGDTGIPLWCVCALAFLGVLVAALVLLLRAGRRSPVASSFRAALPVGCVDGTLKKRLCGTPAAGRVSAKTGTLSGVRTLAGYTTTARGRVVTFAFQLSGAADGARALRAIDRAVVLLAATVSVRAHGGF